MAETQTAPAAEPARGEPKKVRPASAERLGLAEHKELHYHYEVEAGVEPEDLLSVAHWTHIAAQLRQFTQINAWAEDLRWYAEFLVIDVGANWAKVVMKKGSVTKIEKLDPQRKVVMLPGHTVAHGGTFAKWRVIRDADNMVLRDKFATEGDAYGWLADYAKSIAS